MAFFFVFDHTALKLKTFGWTKIFTDPTFFNISNSTFPPFKYVNILERKINFAIDCVYLSMPNGHFLAHLSR